VSDTFSKKARSQIMRSVRSAQNKSTELKLIKLFRELKITGWRRNLHLIGKPDFVFPKRKVVLFTDGCFWHGHNCRNTKPTNNAGYWISKIRRNKARDQKVTKALRQDGWIVIRIWECAIKKNNIKRLKILHF
jgi:DNA mismatch endonuclease (patch repair protein)